MMNQNFAAMMYTKMFTSNKWATYFLVDVNGNNINGAINTRDDRYDSDYDFSLGTFVNTLDYVNQENNTTGWHLCFSKGDEDIKGDTFRVDESSRLDSSVLDSMSITQTIRRDLGTTITQTIRNITSEEVMIKNVYLVLNSKTCQISANVFIMGGVQLETPVVLKPGEIRPISFTASAY